MRKILAVALAALQLLFIVGLIAYQGVIERNLSEKGTEYEFAAEGSYWVIGDARSLRLEIRKASGEIRRADRYWEIVSMANGRAYVRRTARKPENGAYIKITDSDNWGKANLEITRGVSEAFEQRYFPGLREDYYRRNGLEPGVDVGGYGTDNINEKAYGNTFTIKATVWNGHIRFDDFRIDGESIAGYLLPEGDHDA